MLYENIADNLRNQLDKGVYRPGDRLSSVRALSRQLGVSISTVIQAYQLLEDQGLIEARPQSGYYVRPQSQRRCPETRLPKPRSKPMTVDKGELIMEVLETLKDPSLVQLGTASPSADLLPIKELNRIMTGLLKDDPLAVVRYEATPGNLELRTQIARLLPGAGVELSPEELVITNGCQEAVVLALRAVAGAGDIIAVQSPTYYGGLQAIQSLGMKALEIPSDPREGISLDALGLALEQWPIKAVLVMPTCSNPLGCSMPEARKEALVNLCAEAGVPIIENDAHAEFVTDPGLTGHANRPKAAKHYDKTGNVLLCSSFSKTLAPGYRIGWIAAGAYQAKLNYLKYVSNLASPALVQQTLAQFLAKGGYERHVRKMRQLYCRQREQMAEAIHRYFPEGTKSAHGGMVAWVELPGRISGFELYRRALERKISIVPGALFSAQKKYEHYVRLSCGGLWTPTIERAMAVLGESAGQLVVENSKAAA
ncbi:MAG: PLP-dependent aminotransferase family protein [Gammaproteobacteria bacterium]|nr:PLP-dependent aminotransferase family protein [Gammaproteobacteria bacterium]